MLTESTTDTLLPAAKFADLYFQDGNNELKKVTVPIILSLYINIIVMEEQTNMISLCTHIYQTGLEQDSIIDRLWKFVALYLMQTVHSSLPELANTVH